MKRFVSNQCNFLLFKVCLTILTKMRWKLFPSWKASSKKWRKAKDVRVYSNRKSKVECFTLIKLVIKDKICNLTHPPPLSYSLYCELYEYNFGEKRACGTRETLRAHFACHLSLARDHIAHMFDSRRKTSKNQVICMNLLFQQQRWAKTKTAPLPSVFLMTESVVVILIYIVELLTSYGK